MFVRLCCINITFHGTARLLARYMRSCAVQSVPIRAEQTSTRAVVFQCLGYAPCSVVLPGPTRSVGAATGEAPSAASTALFANFKRRCVSALCQLTLPCAPLVLIPALTLTLPAALMPLPVGDSGTESRDLRVRPLILCLVQ